MSYEKPEMELLRFGEHITTLDVIGASQDPEYSDAEGDW